MRKPPGQVLLIDADDTLWENNIYFEQAIAAFTALLNHERHSPAEVREMLNECELATILKHGYGLASFRRSLVACYERLSQRPITEEDRRQIVGLSNRIASQEIELLQGVARALPELAARHRLILVTKGHPEEQREKLSRSGIHTHFSAVEIPPEKDRGAYEALIAKYRLDSATCWMVGNSPKSDINPALAAGLNAVYIHHPGTWVLERESLARAPEGRMLVKLATFGELTEHF